VNTEAGEKIIKLLEDRCKEKPEANTGRKGACLTDLAGEVKNEDSASSSDSMTTKEKKAKGGLGRSRIKKQKKNRKVCTVGLLSQCTLVSPECVTFGCGATEVRKDCIDRCRGA